MSDARKPDRLLDTTDVSFAERHFTVAEIAAMWRLSEDCVRGMFEREPGVLVLGDRTGSRHKRRYRTLRIPESVVQRVHRRESVPAPDWTHARAA